MAFLKLVYDCKNAENNYQEEFIQKVAWRLVRSARDRFKDNQGDLKRNWAIEAIKKQVNGIGDSAEDYIRAAYEHYRIEKKE